MIIGLSGYARSGKDEVAKILVEDYGFTRLAFADKIRQLLLAIDPSLGGPKLSTIVAEYGWDVAKSKSEVRTLLQHLGVAARNLIDEHIWVTTVLNQIEENDKNYVITDVRFENEATAIKLIDGEIWRIRRTHNVPVNNHISEHALDDYRFDQILKNEGSLDDLRELVRKRIEFSLNAK
jgi:dephospho-CoA kinase